MLVFAHLDDETVALGARLGRFGHAHFVHVTDGAPRNEQDSRWHGFRSWQEYRTARSQEFRTLLNAAGISGAMHQCLDVPDQEAGLQLATLARRVAQLFLEHKPEVVFTHPFEGGHPDHDACAFAVHHAVTMRAGRGDPVPIVIEGAFYNAAAAQPGSFLRGPTLVVHREYRLTAGEKQRKQARLDCFVSQRETLQGFPLEWERFRIAPVYDFSKLPHPPPLLYERYPWGMTSERFNQLAREAEAALHVET
jgi:N-acetylglucosamine malate deacetylase 2